MSTDKKPFYCSGNLNFNQKVRARLTEPGKRIWFQHVAKQNAIFRKAGVEPEHDGQEEVIELPLWELIRIFGSARWGLGTTPPISLDVELLGFNS